jgi:hypothetical protein
MMAGPILNLRAPSGLSGDMMLTGLCLISGLGQQGLDEALQAIGMPELSGTASIEPREVNNIAGWGLRVTLPHAHDHRHLSDILDIIGKSALTPRARELSARAFTLLARAEAHVHATTPERIHFHEVGALDSILDVLASCALFDRLSPSRFVCGPLPVCDGAVRCAHGLLPAPAPATLKLLEGIPVYGAPASGETLTPTAVSLLKAFDAEFGPWPAMVITRQERAYGTRVLDNVPNGAVFVWGEPHGLAKP